MQVDIVYLLATYHMASFSFARGRTSIRLFSNTESLDRQRIRGYRKADHLRRATRGN